MNESQLKAKEGIKMAEKKQPELHMYRRAKHPTRRDLWYCIDPACSRGNHKINQMFLLGKLAKCAYCSERFKITAKKLHDQSILHCDNCKRGGSRKEVAIATDAIINDLLKDVI